jgi:squalene cyclase
MKGLFQLKASTLTDTAWALDALITVADRPTIFIPKGITYLLRSLENNDWTTDYPKGQGMGGAFYIHCHSYRYIYPLLALAHYRRKFAARVRWIMLNHLLLNNINSLNTRKAPARVRK